MPFAPSRRSRFLLSAVLALTALAPMTGVAAAVEPGRVIGFTLINAVTDEPIPGYDPIRDDATIELSDLPTRQLSIRVNTAGAVDSVRIHLNEREPRVELNEPYAALGNVGPNYHPWTAVEGEHRVLATPLADGEILVPKTLTFSIVDGGGVSSPAQPGEDEPAPPPSDPPGGGGGSSNCGPVPGVPAGWQRRVSSSFDESTRLGAWPGPVAARDWRSRPAGYRDSSGRGVYNSAKTVSEHDGLLDIWIHSEGGTRYVAAPIPTLGDTMGQRIALCMRADRIPGYKLAFLLWPDQGPGNHHGEIDFPEGKLSPGGTAHAFMHYDPKPTGGKVQDAFNSGVSTVDWHEYVLEWDPGSPASQADDEVNFYLDGRLVGRSTGARVPDGPMHYVMQIETYVAGQALAGHAEGHVLIDWVTIDVPARGTTSATASTTNANRTTTSANRSTTSANRFE